jgi:hypothetical protein
MGLLLRNPEVVMPVGHLTAMDRVAVGRLTVSNIVLVAISSVATSSMARYQLSHFRRLPENIRALSYGLRTA